MWSRASLSVLFLAVHAWHWRVIVVDPGVGFGDVGLYQWWAWDALERGTWPVLDHAWVYPALAVLPVVAPGLASTVEWAPYASAWMLLVTVANAVATVALARRSRLAAVWYLLFLALLGPVAFGRLDAIAVPFAVVGLLAAMRRPRLAAVLLTVGAWVKVAPGALVLPLLVVTRQRVRDVVVPAGLVCVAVVGAVAAGGGMRNVVSFASAQEGRGLQLESVAATWWVVQWVTGGEGGARYDEDLITWEAVGPGTGVAADLLGWLLPVGVGLVTWLAWRARTRLAPAELLAWSGLALTLVLIVVNKVGSPQFLTWLAAPVAVGLALWSRARDDGAAEASEGAPFGWPLVAAWCLVLAALTHLVFPLGYFGLVAGDPAVGWTLVARNVLLAALLCAVVVRLAVVGRRTAVAGRRRAARERGAGGRSD